MSCLFLVVWCLASKHAPDSTDGKKKPYEFISQVAFLHQGKIVRFPPVVPTPTQGFHSDARKLPTLLTLQWQLQLESCFSKASKPIHVWSSSRRLQQLVSCCSNIWASLHISRVCLMCGWPPLRLSPRLNALFFRMTRCRRRPISACRLGGDLCLQCVSLNFVSINLCCIRPDKILNFSGHGFKGTTTCTFTTKPFRCWMTLCYLCKLPSTSCIWTLRLHPNQPATFPIQREALTQSPQQLRRSHIVNCHLVTLGGKSLTWLRGCCNLGTVQQWDHGDSLGFQAFLNAEGHIQWSPNYGWWWPWRFFE